MSEVQKANSNGTPRHLWVVGILALLWNAVGAVDYVMTELRNEAYMSKFTPEELDFFYGMPAWAIAAWAVAVWGAVLGSVLLLLRKRLAGPVFLVSLIALVITTIQNYLISNGLEVMGAFGIGFTALIFLIAVALYLYARAMKGRGILV
jgi:hypothetical protein